MSGVEIIAWYLFTALLCFLVFVISAREEYRKGNANEYLVASVSLFFAFVWPVVMAACLFMAITKFILMFGNKR